MGFTYKRITVCHAFEPHRSTEVNLLVDTGALLSFVPRAVLQELGIPVSFRRAFRLVKGQVMERDAGVAIFRWNGHEGAAQVVFGEPGDESLLGVTALETMGLAVDPTTQSLKDADTYRA